MANPHRLPLIFVSLLASLFSFIVICNAQEHNPDLPAFGYTENSPNGPSKWGALRGAWNLCSNGKMQSPIDINVKQAQVRQDDLKETYNLAPAKLVQEDHAVLVEWEGDPGGIEINGTAYKLVHCHWHTPSEHTRDGVRFDAELHVVHSSDANRKAVVSSFHSIGEPDPFLGSLADKFKAVGPDGMDVGKISASSIKYGSKKYFRYIGSLTSPPCSEDVIWTIIDNIRSISIDQLKILKSTVKPEFEKNARPIQPLGERQIWQFDSPKDELKPELAPAPAPVNETKDGAEGAPASPASPASLNKTREGAEGSPTSPASPASVNKTRKGEEGSHNEKDL